MTFNPPRRSIWFYKCDNEGRKNICPDRCYRDGCNLNSLEDSGKDHFFIIISNNNEQEFVTALPITSSANQSFKNNGIQITADDIELYDSGKLFNPEKKSFVLCNKPCRILKHHLKDQKNFGKVKILRYEQIAKEVSRSII